MEKLWAEFEKKGDIYSYLRYKTGSLKNISLEAAALHGSGKSNRNSDKNI